MTMRAVQGIMDNVTQPGLTARKQSGVLGRPQIPERIACPSPGWRQLRRWLKPLPAEVIRLSNRIRQDVLSQNQKARPVIPAGPFLFIREHASDFSRNRQQVMSAQSRNTP